MSEPVTTQVIRERTAQGWGLDVDEVDWVTDEMLSVRAVDLAEASGMAEEIDEDEGSARAFASTATIVTPGLVPNRISYVSEFWTDAINMGDPIPYWFHCNCDRTQWYMLFTNKMQRYERAGTCGIGNHKFVYRYKLWWRQD